MASFFAQVDGINKHGQGLLQSAAPGVSTSSLETDLESLNDKWSDLNERVSVKSLKHKKNFHFRSIVRNTFEFSTTTFLP